MKTLQAALRGHMQRNDLEKNPRLAQSQRYVSGDDDDRSPRERKRENYPHSSKSNFTGLRNGNENVIARASVEFFLNSIIFVDNMGSTYRDSPSRSVSEFR